MIRDFAKHIICIQAFGDDGNEIAVSKLDKQTWLVAPCDTALVVKYQIYAFDLSVRGAYINDQYAFFNGSNVFLDVVGQSENPCSLKVQHCDYPNLMPLQVATTFSTFFTENETSVGLYEAQNYAELIDHPVLLGEFDKHIFTTDGVEFELVFAGGHQSDLPRIARDLTLVCQQHLQLFGSPAPIQRYLFITLLTDAAFGGLEHRASTALMFARNDLAFINEPSTPSEAYSAFLSLCSHEFFHTWHVKRISPIELVDGTLSAESYTQQLWIYEGITSYFDDLLVLRSKLISVDAYLTIMGQNLTKLARNTGRLKQSLAASSFDAWTKFYKQDESAINHIVSYYNKGAVVAMCLDLLMRKQSKGRYSLDDLMRYLWRYFGRPNIPTPPTVIEEALVSQFGLDLHDFIAQAVLSTKELPVESLLADFGIKLNLRSRIDNNDKGGKAAQKTSRHDVGINFKAKEIGIEVTQVFENSSAYEAGIVVGDIIIAIDNWQISASTMQSIIDRLEPTTPRKISLLRDKRFIQVDFNLRPAVLDTVYLSIDNKEKMQRWLG